LYWYNISRDSWWLSKISSVFLWLKVNRTSSHFYWHPFLYFDLGLMIFSLVWYLINDVPWTELPMTEYICELNISNKHHVSPGRFMSLSVLNDLWASECCTTPKFNCFWIVVCLMERQNHITKHSFFCGQKLVVIISKHIVDHWNCHPSGWRRNVESETKCSWNGTATQFEEL